MVFCSAVEAFCDTVALMKKNGLSSKSVVNGLRFPLNNHYERSIVLLRHKVPGILLSSITVSGMAYNVYYGVTQ